ncbi:stalk domain-containing protein [Paenibacillus sp. FSL W7-1287]|uniref:stalk domain-containing protein n=1 Tax=Paenibacillus sp. FSL W7-1287 TaxID=2954538 RepID=UPI0030F828ED
MKKKVFATIMATTVIASMATGVYGATKLQEIKAYLNPGISFKVDGVPTQLKDSSGLAVVPISYKNTTYLPVRAVSDALGVAVNYDGKTETINLGEVVDGIALSKDFRSDNHTKDPAQTTYKGKDYKEAFYNDNNANRGVSFMLYPKGRYQTLYLQIAALGEPFEKIQIKDSDNDIILKEIEVIDPSEGLITIEVDIGGVDTLYVHGSADRNGQVFVPLTTSYFK